MPVPNLRRVAGAADVSSAVVIHSECARYSESLFPRHRDRDAGAESAHVLKINGVAGAQPVSIGNGDGHIATGLHGSHSQDAADRPRCWVTQLGNPIVSDPRWHVGD